MGRTRIKICGIRTPEAALAAADAGADAIGLVFVPGSPREVDIATAMGIVETLPAMVEPIALFANESPGRIVSIAQQLRLRTVQLHGRESVEDVRAIAPLRVLKAIAFEQETLQDTLATWRSGPANVAAMLIDSPPPAQAQITGGHGQSFDWASLAQVMDQGLLADLPRWMLAGGLTPANVEQAIGMLRPYAVDVSSGVEASRGVKDIQKIHAFCEAVRRADASRA